MASYKPKSLNELNKLYDKSMAAQNAIKKSGSAITADSDEAEKTAEYLQQELPSSEKTPTQIASDELSEAISGFIKNFGETDTGKEKPVSRQPLPITKAIKSTAKKDTSEDEADAADSHSHKAEKKEKPILMRNAERSELLDDYMKIMNDDDDDVAYLKNIIKKKKKSKKDKHQGSPLSDTQGQESEETSYELSEAAPEAEAASEYEAEPQAEETEATEDFYADKSDGEEEENEAVEEEKPAKKNKKGKNVFLQIFFMLLLLSVLIGAVTLSAIKIVTNADKNDPITDKYSLFTIDRDFEKAELKSGDLVITQSRAVAENDVFAYKNTYGELVFAVKGTQIGTDRFMAHYDGEVDLIEEAAVRGVVIKTIPTLGNIVKILTDNFIIIISVLIAVALIIILILALAFRSKSNYEIDDSDYSDALAEAADEEYNYDEQDGDEDYEDDTESDNLFETID